MTDNTFRAFLRDLDNRRLALKMTKEALARRSGLTRVTVSRLLSGSHPNASFLHIVAIGEALGVQVEFKSVDADQFAEAQAKKHANRLVGMMQGTMGLESQAVSSEFIERMEEDASQRILAGSGRKLWSE